VIDAARKHSNLKIMAGFSRRFDASYRDAASRIFNDQAIGRPFMVFSNTCDLIDNTEFSARYASRNSGIFVDCAIHIGKYLKTPLLSKQTDLRRRF
jgi:myo-inositol 2-dehydrogenase/D-chiro-inositol 1-dehydrogenase